VDGSQTAGGVGTGGLSEAEGEVVDDDKAVGHTVGGGAGHTCDRSKLRASQFRIPIIYSDFNICYLKFSSGVWEIRFQVFPVSIFFCRERTLSQNVTLLQHNMFRVFFQYRASHILY
jgi:hypothetical protein